MLYHSFLAFFLGKHMFSVESTLFLESRSSAFLCPFMFCSPGMNIRAFVHICNYLHDNICVHTMMYLSHMYTYKDLCMCTTCIPTRTYVCPWIIYMYIYIYTYQDLCPWIICIIVKTYALGLYIYQDLCP